MFLRYVRICNFMSLEDVELPDLGEFNTLIGRNNAGKSAVFKAFRYLAQVVNNQDLERFQEEDGLAALTNRDTGRSLEYCLRFEPQQKDREEFVGLLSTASGNPERRRSLLDSQFFREVEYVFRSAPGAPHFLHLRETHVSAEDADRAVIQRMKRHDNERTRHPTIQFADFVGIDRKGIPFNKEDLDVDTPKFRSERPVEIGELSTLGSVDPLPWWIQARLARWLADCFFFSSFRHCKPEGPSQNVQRLAQDGTNLPQVLNTILSGDRPKFDQIESFVLAAAPNLGRLQPPLKANHHVEVGFSSDLDYFTHLHEMGGGIEQLVMVATVLLTTPETSTLLLEEPESHLHPSALRFLLGKLAGGGRQVFTTTHSPILLNAVPSQKVFKATYNVSRTQISPVRTDSLGDVLEEIGARNSDVLLSDAVLFVEGPSDEEALRAWGEILGKDLAAHNVTILHMEGGEYAEQKGPPRADVLKGISDAAPVPHLFLLDRDEREEGALAKLAERLEGHCHVLAMRELENYLLISRPLLDALRSKATRGGHPRAQELLEVTTGEIETLIGTAVNDLFARVLLRRIRAKVPGLRGRIIERDGAEFLEPHARDPDLADRIHGYLTERLTGHLKGVDLQSIVQQEREKLETEWEDPDQRLGLVPGEEVLVEVYGRFDLNYSKTKDAVRIARAMQTDEIAEELSALIERVVSLPGQ